VSRHGEEHTSAFNDPTCHGGEQCNVIGHVLNNVERRYEIESALLVQIIDRSRDDLAVASEPRGFCPTRL
jgi:hypothetical protein